jgi:hypothetical protein
VEPGSSLGATVRAIGAEACDRQVHFLVPFWFENAPTKLNPLVSPLNAACHFYAYLSTSSSTLWTVDLPLVELSGGIHAGFVEWKRVTHKAFAQCDRDRIYAPIESNINTITTLTLTESPTGRQPALKSSSSNPCIPRVYNYKQATL